MSEYLPGGEFIQKWIRTRGSLTDPSVNAGIWTGIKHRPIYACLLISLHLQSHPPTAHLIHLQEASWFTFPAPFTLKRTETGDQIPSRTQVWSLCVPPVKNHSKADTHRASVQAPKDSFPHSLIYKVCDSHSRLFTCEWCNLINSHWVFLLINLNRVSVWMTTKQKKKLISFLSSSISTRFKKKKKVRVCVHTRAWGEGRFFC